MNNMERTDVENQSIPEPGGGKAETNLSALANSLQFLSLGVPGISRPKKFNVNAWSTPLKSIENQQRRVARKKISEIESADNVDDDSLSNLTDLFPGQNFLEKTSDFIEYYRLNSPEETDGAPAPPVHTTGSSFARALPTRSPNESTVAAAGRRLSNSPSDSESPFAEKSASFSNLPVGPPVRVASCFSPQRLAEKLEPSTTRLSERLSTDCTIPQTEWTSNRSRLDVLDCDSGGACLASISHFDEKNRRVRESGCVSPSCSVAVVDSPLDVQSAVYATSWAAGDVDESAYRANDDDEDGVCVAIRQPFTPQLPSDAVCDVLESANRVSSGSDSSCHSTPKREADVSTSPDNRAHRVAAATSCTQLRPSEAGSSPAVGDSDHAASLSGDSAIRSASEFAGVTSSSIDVYGEHDELAFAPHRLPDAAAAESAAVSGDDTFEDCAESQHSALISLHGAVANGSKTPLSGYFNSNHSDTTNTNISFSAVSNSATEENERFVECEVECEYGVGESVSVEKTVNTRSCAENPLPRSDDRPSDRFPTSAFHFRHHTCTDVTNERVRVSLKTDRFDDASMVDVISMDIPVAPYQPTDEPNSSLETPTKYADQGQRMPSDQLARVCSSVNKLISLCTPMTNLRTRSRTAVNPFRCENAGSESQKILFDLPPNLLDVSIGMLESMAAMMAPTESSSGVTYLEERNVASDLITVARTPKVIQTQTQAQTQTQSQSNENSSSGRLNASTINKRLLEENENLKKELEEYKRKHDILQGEYESVLKTAYALRTNETILKNALREYEDETRKACNKYHILKEYADTLIISLNRSLDQCEEELKLKSDELQKLKKNFL